MASDDDDEERRWLSWFFGGGREDPAPDQDYEDGIPKGWRFRHPEEERLEGTDRHEMANLALDDLDGEYYEIETAVNRLDSKLQARMVILRIDKFISKVVLFRVTYHGTAAARHAKNLADELKRAKADLKDEFDI